MAAWHARRAKALQLDQHDATITRRTPLRCVARSSLSLGSVARFMNSRRRVLPLPSLPPSLAPFALPLLAPVVLRRPALPAPSAILPVAGDRRLSLPLSDIESAAASHTDCSPLVE